MKDEARHIQACLAALATQVTTNMRPIAAGSFGVVLLANNCRDESPQIARSMARELPYLLRVVERNLPRAQAHAGGARRAAMDFADAWLLEDRSPEGVILTTDADSRVPANWIAANLAAIRAGADAVLGRVALDEEGAALPAALHQRGRLESEYEELLCEISSCLDPAEHNPWPHHSTISGASLSVTRQMYRRAGGLPCVPLGEDKAFISMLLRLDGRLRFSPEIEVVTSGRTNGRAPGGVADTLRLRAENPEAYCDESLEPFRIAVKRARWRGQLRTIWRGGFEGTAWPAGPGFPRSLHRHFSASATFGAAWAAIENECPALVRRFLIPSDLPAQIAGASRALQYMRKVTLHSRQHIDPEITASILVGETGDAIQMRDEELGSLIAG